MGNQSNDSEDQFTPETNLSRSGSWVQVRPWRSFYPEISFNEKRLLYSPAEKQLGSYGSGLGSFSDLSHGDTAASDR